MDPKAPLQFFTRAELAAALALLIPANEADALASEVYGRPEADLAYFDWIDTTLTLPALSSPSCRSRVQAHFTSPDNPGELAEQEAQMRRILARPPLEGRVVEAEDIVYDRRQDD